MKVKNILFGILMCTAYLAYSQNTTPTHILFKKDSVGNIAKTITRAYGNNSISYMEIDGKHYFSYASYMQTVPEDSVLLNSVEISADYTVNDFKIVDSSHIYCCGVNNSTSQGFIAFFSISDFIVDNTINFKVVNNLQSNDGHVEDLTKIETFFIANKLHVIAIGIASDSKACILEIVGNKGATSVTYKVGSSSASEKFNDIAVTDNYVVTVGSISSPDATIRRFPKQSIFSNSAYNSLVYSYPTNTSNNNPTMYIAENTDDFLIAPVVNDIVAIASYWYYPPLANLGNDLQGTLMRIYNIAQTTAPVMMSSISINQLYYSGNWKLKELQYNNSLQMFTLLQDMELPSTQQLSSVISTLDFVNNPNITQFKYLSGIELRSLDNITNSIYNIISGYAVGNSTNYFILIGDKVNNQSLPCGYDTYSTNSFKTTYENKDINMDIAVFTRTFNCTHIKFTNNYSIRMIYSCGL